MLSPIPALLPPQYHHLPNEAISSSARLERRRSTWCHLHPGKPPYSRQGLVAGPLSKQGDLVGVCSPTATKRMLRWFEWKEFSPQEPVLSSSVTSTCWLFLFFSSYMASFMAPSIAVSRLAICSLLHICLLPSSS